jgi:protein-disulfide isomerase
MLRKKILLMMGAFLCAGGIVGGAFWYALHSAPKQDAGTPVNIELRDPSQDEHILGNPKAPLVFVVYSDFQCPYCKEYHQTMRAIMETYGKEGLVALVYRHLPVPQLHERAFDYAVASECIAQEGGNDAFWHFADELFAKSNPNTSLSDGDLISLAKNAGVSETTFTTCLHGNTFKDKIDADYREGIHAGARETPFTILITPHQKVPVAEARPYPVVAASIERALQALGYRKEE